MDPRYPYHANLYFLGYNNNGYRIHLWEKNNVDYHPQSMIRYRNHHWNKYTDNIYPVHLINKRYY